MSALQGRCRLIPQRGGGAQEEGMKGQAVICCGTVALNSCDSEPPAGHTFAKLEEILKRQAAAG